MAADRPDLTTGAEPEAPFRRQVAGALEGIVAGAGTEVVALATIYDEVEARFGPLLDRTPRPGRESQQLWHHAVQWEIESALGEGRLIRRADLGRGTYMLPGVGDQRWDVVITVPRAASRDWTALDRIFIPGKARPLDLVPGSKVWLRQGGRLVHRAEVTAVEHHDERVSALDGTDFGAGWVAEVTGWEDTDLTDAEIGSQGRWGQARLRYLDPATLLLRGGTPAPTGVRWPGAAPRRRSEVTARPSGTEVTWKQIENTLLVDWTEWATAAGRTIDTPKVTTGDATVETDRVRLHERGAHRSEELIGTPGGQARDRPAAGLLAPPRSAPPTRDPVADPPGPVDGRGGPERRHRVHLPRRRRVHRVARRPDLIRQHPAEPTGRPEALTVG